MNKLIDLSELFYLMKYYYAFKFFDNDNLCLSNSLNITKKIDIFSTILSLNDKDYIILNEVNTFCNFIIEEYYLDPKIR